jgi:tetratricopeptide (TPR) repeat protein
LNSVRGHLDYAMLAEHDNDYAGAAKEYLAAIAAAPRGGVPDDVARYATTAHLSLGRIYINNLKEYDRGEKEVRFWLANPPKGTSTTNVATAHYCLGVVHQQGGRPDQARAEYQTALAANPKHEDAKKALASLK